MDLFDALKEKKILLIDDDEWIRDSLKRFFAWEECYLETCDSAVEGLQVLHEQQFDIVFIDYRLPDMDGLDLLKRIQLSRPSAKKILLTAYGNGKIAAKAREAAACWFIQKPIDTKNIEKVLRSILNL